MIEAKDLTKHMLSMLQLAAAVNLIQKMFPEEFEYELEKAIDKHLENVNKK